MNRMIASMNITDDEWTEAAVAQLRDDVRGLPGGAKAFVAEHSARLGTKYDAFAGYLRGDTPIPYQTFMRSVSILGYTAEEFDARITRRIEAERRRRGTR
ncbi:hypothetical protein JNB62_15905 [Microbacterium jejuense]|uniref:Uncharacterized protein n=1 Tax=Microbacterium jejuense TaxID=1263637 RepID=A0ABS7HSE5_9MICO|nr:hypothetical protein [Microbacterium jejuense]MBW9095171.1 hypothetical protein [Microbacterium jejuense]